MAIDVPNSLVGEPSSNNGHDNGTSESKIISTSIITYPRINRKLLPIIGLFVFYIGHDALQEEMFRFPGFKFGFFMTFVAYPIGMINVCHRAIFIFKPTHDQFLFSNQQNFPYIKKQSVCKPLD